MIEFDAFERIINDFGPPEHAKTVPPDVIELYKERIPRSMIIFWEKYGWGEYRSGYCRIADPRSFEPLLKVIFANDPEFSAEDLTVINFTAFCAMDIWSRKGYGIYIDICNSRAVAQNKIVNPATGERYGQDFLIGTSLYSQIENDGMDEYYQEASARLGRPALDEVFGFVPALQIGGDPAAENLQLFKAREYMDFLVQLEPPMLTEITAPEPGAPLGQMRDVRRLGAR
ncbi:hypothetical protein GGQ91_004283 [Methylobacterium fujisawaense]|uniref:GAD-related domain-containing protein n=1 Tax=Methylobacterium fujisawaense TaxID=107400 RepID=A0ABR6DFK7_9HYPH|nr:GAD-like domain-containing protein [Methylobacterium fujisawaense]MBA9064877.1 hypothetical protein [Methylobacterium fujisawaense]